MIFALAITTRRINREAIANNQVSLIKVFLVTIVFWRHDNETIYKKENIAP